MRRPSGDAPFEVLFLPARGGDRFALFYLAGEATPGSVICLVRSSLI